MSYTFYSGNGAEYKGDTMGAYNFVGITCLRPSLRNTVEELSKINLGTDEINAYYELMAEELHKLYGKIFSWNVTGRTYSRRRGTMQFRGDACRILIHTSGMTAACVIHELAHVVVHWDSDVRESHGPNFAKAFDILIDHAKGFLF